MRTSIQPNRIIRAAILGTTLAVTATAFAQAFTYTNDFSAISGEFGSTPTPASGYFYRLGTNGRFAATNANGTLQGTSTVGYDGAFDTSVHAGKLGAAWKNGADNVTYSSEFIRRDFRTDETLSAGSWLTSPTLSIDTLWRYGDWQNNPEKRLVYVGFLNDEGKGYVVSLSRTGTGTFYQIDSAFSQDISTWTTLGTYSLTQPRQDGGGAGTNINTLTFSIIGSSLSVTTSTNTGVAASFDLSSQGTIYGEFSSIVIGASMSNSEKVLFDNLTVIATTTAVPEPATAALLIGSLLSFAAAITHHRHRRTHGE